MNDARNNVTYAYVSEHWQSTGSSQQSKRIGAGGLQGANLSTEMWTLINFALKAGGILEGFRLSRRWHVIDLHTQIPPCDKART